MAYCNRVTPPNVVSTMVSVVAATQYAFGKSHDSAFPREKLGYIGHRLLDK